MRQRFFSEPMPLHGVLEYGFLTLNGDVVDTYICLSAISYGSDAAVLFVTCGQRDDGIVLQLVNQVRQCSPGLGNCGPGFEQDEIGYRSCVGRYFEIDGTGEQRAAG